MHYGCKSRANHPKGSNRPLRTPYFPGFLPCGQLWHIEQAPWPDAPHSAGDPTDPGASADTPDRGPGLPATDPAWRIERGGFQGYGVTELAGEGADSQRGLPTVSRPPLTPT